jgi:hypothetical protein
MNAWSATTSTTDHDDDDDGMQQQQQQQQRRRRRRFIYDEVQHTTYAPLIQSCQQLIHHHHYHHHHHPYRGQTSACTSWQSIMLMFEYGRILCCLNMVIEYTIYKEFNSLLLLLLLLMMMTMLMMMIMMIMLLRMRYIYLTVGIVLKCCSYEEEALERYTSYEVSCWKILTLFESHVEKTKTGFVVVVVVVVVLGGSFSCSNKHKKDIEYSLSFSRSVVAIVVVRPHKA